jgi:uncharacterized protein YidB (DUF937 family)
MGLLDSVLGAALGGNGGSQGGGGQAMLMQVIGMLLQGQGGGAQGGGGLGGMLGGALGSALGGGGGAGAGAGGLGGLGGLLAQLQQGGLGDAAQSWVSTGENMPVSGDQLSAALGADRIDAIAQQVGMPAGDLSSQLAQYLPQVVDRMTPNGQLPEGGADLGGLLGNVLGGLLKP